MTLEDEFEEFISDSCKSVSMGNHNLLDTSLTDEFQKGMNSFSTEIDPGGDFLDDLEGRVCVPQHLDLSFEVFRLMRGRDSRVDDATRFLGVFAKLLCNIVSVI